MFGLESNFKRKYFSPDLSGFKNQTGLLPANNTEAQHLPPFNDYFCAIKKNPNTEDPALNAKVRHITY